jgi:hypothetical protein
VLRNDTVLQTISTLQEGIGRPAEAGREEDDGQLAAVRSNRQLLCSRPAASYHTASTPPADTQRRP